MMEERLLSDYIRIRRDNESNLKSAEGIKSSDSSVSDYEFNTANCDCLNFWRYSNDEDKEDTVRKPIHNLSNDYGERYDFKKQPTHQEEMEDMMIDTYFEKSNQDTIFREDPRNTNEEGGGASESTKLSFTSSSFSEGDGIEPEQQHQQKQKQHEDQRQNSLLDPSASDGSSTLSFDPNDFDEREFESDFDMEDSGQSSIVFDTEAKLETIDENLEKSFSCDVGNNFNPIFLWNR